MPCLGPNRRKTGNTHMLRKFGVAAIVGVLLTAGTALPASAEEEQAEEIVDVVEQAEEDTFDVVSENVDVTEAVDGDFEASTNLGEVEVPAESDDPIEIETRAGTLEIDLPGTKKEQGDLVGDSVAYPDVGEDLGVVVDATEDGVRISTVIANQDAPHVIDYDISVPGNGYLQLEDEGSVSVRNMRGKVLNWIAPPWATDSAGESVETWYEVRDNTLTQHVNPSSAVTYPITADPYTCGWRGCYFVLSKSATKDIATTGPAGALICAAIGAYTGGVGIVSCAAGYVPYFIQATRAYNRGQCLAVPIAGTGPKVEGGRSCR